MKKTKSNPAPKKTTSLEILIGFIGWFLLINVVLCLIYFTVFSTFKDIDKTNIIYIFTGVSTLSAPVLLICTINFWRTQFIVNQEYVLIDKTEEEMNNLLQKFREYEDELNAWAANIIKKDNISREDLINYPNEINLVNSKFDLFSRRLNQFERFEKISSQLDKMNHQTIQFDRLCCTTLA